MRVLARDTEDLARESVIRQAVQKLIDAKDAGKEIEGQEVTIKLPGGKRIKVVVHMVEPR